MQSYRELVRFTGELDWKRERSLCVLLEPRSRKRSRAWRSILLFLRNYYPQSVIHFSIYIYILTRYYSYKRLIKPVNTSSRRFFIQFRDTFSSPFFPKRFNAFQEWNILIALTGTLFEHVSQCASQIFEICIRRKGGGKGRRVVYGFAWNLHLCLSELSRNSWKTRLVERSLGNGPASTSTSPAIILELILGSEALTSRQTLVLILQIKERVVRAIEEILIEAHNITLAD